KNNESLGRTKLYVNEEVVAEGPMRTQSGKFTLSGDGLCVGRDSGDNVSQEYASPGDFTGGTILGVGVSVGKQQYLDLEKMAAAAFAAEQLPHRLTKRRGRSDSDAQPAGLL